MTTTSGMALKGLLAAFLVLPCAMASNLNFTYRGPLAHMTEADWEMFRAEGVTMLETGVDGQTYRWTNDETGTSGSFTPHQSVEQDGRPCRLVTVTLAAGSAQGSQVMTVCKDSDGSWGIVK